MGVYKISIDELRGISELIATLSGVPVRAYDRDNKISINWNLPLAADPFDTFEGGFSKFGSGSRLIRQDRYYYGIVSNDEYHIVLGPVGDSISSPGDNVAVTAAKLGLAGTEASDFALQMRTIRRPSLFKTLTLMRIIHYMMSGSLIRISEISLKGMDPADFGSPGDPDIYAVYQKRMREFDRFDSTPAERLSIKMVIDGDINGVKKLMDTGNVYSELPQFYEDPLKNAKAAFYAAAASLLYQLSENGADFGKADALRRYYYSRCEKLTDPEDVIALIRSMAMDFTARNDTGSDFYHYSKLTLDAIDYIGKNLTRFIDTSDVAKAMFVSRSRLSTLFKKETGVNLSDYIHLKKLAMAKVMLEGDMQSVGEIAEILAYKSQSHFTSVFRKFENMTPKEYRRQYLVNSQGKESK